MMTLRKKIKAKTEKILLAEVKTTQERTDFLQNILECYQNAEMYENCSLVLDTIKKLNQVQKTKKKEGSRFENLIFKANFQYSVLVNEYISQLTDDYLNQAGLTGDECGDSYIINIQL